MGRSQPRRGKQRRALTGAKSGGRVTSGGDARYARGLRDALAAPSVESEDAIATSLTHGFHSYPARMHPATAHAIVVGLEPKALLDPFCGSGTTLVEAIRGRAESTGIDANPFAVRLATTKTWLPGRKRIKELSVVGRQVADAAIEEVKAARRGKGARAEEKASRPKARKALRGKFPPHVLAELETLRSLIGGCEPEIASHLEMVLSSILHKVSLRSSDTDASIVRKQVPRAAASRHFRERVVSYSDTLRGLDRAGGPPPTVLLSDAREAELPNAHFDLVLTSPPYPGTYDYVDHHQLRMDFLEIDSRTFAQKELGARRHFRGAAANVERSLKRWQDDTTEILRRLRTSMRSDGFLCMLVGDSLANTKAVRANIEMPPLAEAAGLKPIAWASQTRRILGTREREAFSEAPKREHLLLFALK